MMKTYFHTSIFFYFTLILITVCSANIYSQPRLEYYLSMNEPHTHYFEVTTIISGLKKESIDLIMPVWAPGSYLIRDFPKNVEFFGAYDNDQNKLRFEKINKYTWRVYSNNTDVITIQYKVYAFSKSVRTSFLDTSHGYINGSSVFMYIDKMKGLPSTLEIMPYIGWNVVSTGLEKINGNKFKYSSPDYDILADSPIEIGNHKVFEFDAAGVKHYIAMYGEGNYDIDTLKKYMAKIVEAETKVIGENPNKDYTFIIHNLENGSGGLEHLNSTTLEVNRWIYSPDSNLKKFLSTMAHEYFHLWNVKRIRPIALGPFDYSSENYTHLLWEMEGVTSYYSGLILLRTGIIDNDQFFGRIAGGISYIENTPGSKVQSPAESSFDTWIKQYQPDENSNNTAFSYYSSGAMLGMLLDLEILNSTDGEKNYDDLLKYLYNEYYKKQKRGFSSKEYRSAIEKITGKNMDWFFDDYVYSTKDVDYNKFLNYAGLKLVDTGKDEVYLGIRTSDDMIVKTVTAGTSAYDGGINVNDEILSINNFRVTKDNFEKIFSQFKSGDTLKILVSRDGKILQLDVPLKRYHRYNYTLVKIDNPTDKQQLIYNRWLSAN